MSQRCIDVAIGLVFYQSKVLVGWRNHEQHQGGKHEFPGGKVEVGESAVAACQREIFEEVGIDLVNWHVFDLIEHQYDDITVRLHIFHAQLPQQQLAAIKTPWAWYSRPALVELNFPAANQQIIRRLLWPKLIKIGTDITALQQLSADRDLYLRYDADQFDQVIEQVATRPMTLLQRLIVNVELWAQLSHQQQINIGAVHFKQQQLQQLTQQDLPQQIRCIAACHDAQSIAQANRLGVDAIILSPVLDTPTHPEQSGLGWQHFAELAIQTQLPVFALGGMAPENLAQAEQHHAYGLAGIRNF